MANRDKNKNEYDTSFLFYEKYPWLCSHRNGFEELIKLCSQNREQRELILDLIGRFRYLTLKERGNYCQKMVNHIFNVWKCSPNRTLLVAMADNEYLDNSHALLQCVRHVAAGKGYDKVRYPINIQKVIEDPQKAQKQIVIIDEFIGSSEKVSGAIDDLMSSGIQLASIYVCSIAIMESGLRALSDKGMELYYSIKLKKGISGYDCDRKSRLKVMDSLEDLLAKNTRVFPYGSGQSETLYYMEESNAVNNMFPIFWWSKMNDGSKRERMFVRAIV